MRTATIYVYQMHGTYQWVADIRYRGKIIVSVDRNNVAEWKPAKYGIIGAAVEKAFSLGFTHCKVRG
jgi:hypothetical protein